MTVLEPLATLESAVLECKQRDIKHTEVREALDSLEPYVCPVPSPRFGRTYQQRVDLEGQQQVFRVTFPGIRDSVRELIARQMDALARKFHDTHDMNVKDEIEQLAREQVSATKLVRLVDLVATVKSVDLQNAK